MKTIRDHADYEKALARIEELISAPEGAPEVGELEVLAILKSTKRNTTLFRKPRCQSR